MCVCLRERTEREINKVINPCFTPLILKVYPEELPKTNPSQYSLVCPIPSELFGPHGKPLQLGTRPAKDICPTTKSPRLSPRSCKASSRRRFQSWHKFQFGEDPSSEEAFRVCTNSDVIRELVSILNRQLVGSGNPQKNLPVSFPEVVQP